MILSTTESIEGYEIREHLGIVTGNTVRAKFIGKDILASLRNIIGGEVKEYTEMLSESRNEAIKRMMAGAAELGADGVVGVRFTSAQVSQAASEMLAFGTAVKLSKK